MKFKCYDCSHIFSGKGKKKEYNDAIYGPCSKIIAICPKCGNEAIEFVVNNSKGSKSKDLPPCGMDRSCSCCSG